MAAVTFNIRAIDGTRGAFASVNQGLRGLIKGGDETQKKMLKMGAAFLGIGSVIGMVSSHVRKVGEDIRAVPGVNDDVIASWDRLNLVVGTSGSVFDNMVATAGHGISSLAGLIRFGAIAAVKGLNEAEKDLLETEKAAADAAKLTPERIDKESESLKKMWNARKALKNASETEGRSIIRRRAEAYTLEQQAKSTKDLVRQNELLAESYDTKASAERDFKKLMDAQKEADRLATESYVKMSSVGMSNSKKIELQEKALKNVNNQLAQYNKLTDPEQAEKRTELLKRQKEIQDDLAESYYKAGEVYRDAGGMIAGAFEEAIFNGGKLKDVLRGLAQDLMRLVFRKTITEPLANAFTSGLGKMFGGKFAAGGPVTGGKTILVGENGPELFQPNASGRIIPNGSIGGGGGGNTYYIDARGADRTGIAALRNELRQLRADVVPMAIAGVSNQRIRGGMRGAAA